MIVEIWAEAGRNPRVAEITRPIDADVLGGLERLIDAAKAARRRLARARLALRRPLLFHLSSPASSSAWRSSRISTAEAEAAMALGVFKALFAGAFAPDADVERCLDEPRSSAALAVVAALAAARVRNATLAPCALRRAAAARP